MKIIIALSLGVATCCSQFGPEMPHKQHNPRKNSYRQQIQKGRGGQADGQSLVGMGIRNVPGIGEKLFNSKIFSHQDIHPTLNDDFFKLPAPEFQTDSSNAPSKGMGINRKRGAGRGRRVISRGNGRKQDGQCNCRACGCNDCQNGRPCQCHKSPQN